jgi:hypothetical protein
VYVYNGFGNSNCYLPFVSKLFEYVHVEYVNNLDFLKNKRHSPLENISGTELKENLDHAKIRYIGVCCGAYLAGKHIFFDDVKKGTLGERGKSGREEQGKGREKEQGKGREKERKGREEQGKGREKERKGREEQGKGREKERKIKNS